MSKGNEPAYPVKKRVLDQCASMQQRKEVFADVVSGGLTKRELFAAMAMQGLMSRSDSFPSDASKEAETRFVVGIAAQATRHADALLDELERTA